MYNLYRAVQQRLETLLTAEATLTSDLLTGETEVFVDDATNFGTESIIGDYNNILLYDSATTGKRIEGGYQGTEIVNADSVYVTSNKINLKTAVTRDWLTSSSAKIKRAPAGINVHDVIYGDLSVIKKFPSVCVSPTTESMEWVFFYGSKETVNMEIMVYVQQSGSENALKDVTKLADAIKWILMSNLHITPIGESAPTSRAIVPSVEYGNIQKGSTFLKAARINWTGEVYYDRNYVVGQSPTSG